MMAAEQNVASGSTRSARLPDIIGVEQQAAIWRPTLQTEEEDPTWTN